MSASIDGAPRRGFRYYDLLVGGMVGVLLCSNLIGPAKVCTLYLPVISARPGPVSGALVLAVIRHSGAAEGGTRNPLFSSKQIPDRSLATSEMTKKKSHSSIKSRPMISVPLKCGFTASYQT